MLELLGGGILGSVLGGVFRAPGVTVRRGVCVLLALCGGVAALGPAGLLIH